MENTANTTPEIALANLRTAYAALLANDARKVTTEEEAEQVREYGERAGQFFAAAYTEALEHYPAFYLGETLTVIKASL